jgi:hypothetical protein
MSFVGCIWIGINACISGKLGNLEIIGGLNIR